MPAAPRDRLALWSRRLRGAQEIVESDDFVTSGYVMPAKDGGEE